MRYNIGEGVGKKEFETIERMSLVDIWGRKSSFSM